MKYVFDLDDTILFSKLKDGEYKIVGSANDIIDIINELYDKGNEIILYTGRHWNHLQITLKQLKEYKIKYHTLMMGKPVADYYIDDKGIKPGDFINEYRKSL